MGTLSERAADRTGPTRNWIVCSCRWFRQSGAPSNDGGMLSSKAGDARLSLSPVDLIIIVVYFALVSGSGWLPAAVHHDGEEFFMAGREMTTGSPA